MSATVWWLWSRWVRMASVSRVLSSQDGRKAPEAGSLVWGDPALETAVTVKAESWGGTEGLAGTL